MNQQGSQCIEMIRERCALFDSSSYLDFCGLGFSGFSNEPENVPSYLMTEGLEYLILQISLLIICGYRDCSHSSTDFYQYNMPSQTIFT
jgi:hypothetical protein